MPAITNVNELQAMNDNLAGNYWLSNDIDASATVGWNAGKGFVPIGQSPPYFTGTFDGKGHTISDLFINRPLEDYVGLFGIVSTGVVINSLKLEDANITGDDYIGGVAGYFLNGVDVFGSSVTGSVTGDNNVGGFAGYSSGASGNNNIFTKCRANVIVTGGDWVGGFVGGAGNTDFARCYSLGNVVAITSGGGFIRAAYGSNCIVTFTDCYARGNVHAGVGGGNCAGFIHSSNVWGTGSVAITNCYSTGAVDSDFGDAYGFIWSTDVTDTTITACFWDIQTSGTATSDGAIGKTTAQMKTKSTFTSADWDFIIIWAMNGITNDGYPFHWTMPPEPPPDAPRRTVLVEDEITLKSVRNLEMASRGRFRIDEQGKAVWRSRYARNP